MLTQKQERFCLNIFGGMSQREAYVKAGYSSKSAPCTIDCHASELANSDKVLARLAVLNQKAEDGKVASVKERKHILTEIIRTNSDDIMNLSEDGRDLMIKREALKSPAVSYVRTEQVNYGKMPVRITRLGLIDKVKAADILNKMDKVYEAQPTINQDNRVLNIFVLDGETKGLISQVKDRTRPQLEEKT